MMLTFCCLAKQLHLSDTTRRFTLLFWEQERILIQHLDYAKLEEATVDNPQLPEGFSQQVGLLIRFLAVLY